ncbi:phage protein [Lentilactobacillus kosonis]|uniref:Phage protein n=2 Tax=Lentilactobacillus kosonis TaxID=2810561 RepID=A0A401FPQ7_9LACO|nr:phage protein [Lentilactobacillus kosonis]
MIPEGTQFSTDDAQIFETTDDLTVGEATSYVDEGGIVQPLQDDDGNPLGRGTVSAVSQDTGAEMNVMPGTIINSEEALDGFNAVTNINGAQGGGDIETDDQYRIRILENRKHPINSTISGIETALINVTGVEDVRIVNNIEMTPDEYGNPAKSIHVYVIGGLPDDIAQALFDVLPPVTKTVGSVASIAKDIGGKWYRLCLIVPQLYLYLLKWIFMLILLHLIQIMVSQ